MRILFFTFLIVGCLFSQDTLIDAIDNVHPAKVIAIDSSYIALIEEGEGLISIAPHRVFKTITLESGEILIDNHKLIVGADHALWYTETKQLHGKTHLPSITAHPLHIAPENSKLLILPPDVVNMQNRKYVSSSRIGGGLIALSAVLGLYLINNEYDGELETIEDVREYQDWGDSQQRLWNMHYFCLGAGGVMIAIDIDF